jgi:hypothetical protein
MNTIVENASGQCGWCQKLLSPEEKRTHNASCKVRAYCMQDAAPATAAKNLTQTQIANILGQ